MNFLRILGMAAAVFLLAFAALPASAGPAADQDKTGAAVDAATARPAVDGALLKAYMERAGASCRLVDRGEVRANARAGGETFELLARADTKRYFAYVAVADLFDLPKDHPRLASVTERMARLNYQIAIGKLEWDADGGVVRLSHAFSTEDGLGYRSFTGTLATLLAQAGPLRRELEAASKPPPSR